MTKVQNNPPHPPQSPSAPNQDQQAFAQSVLQAEADAISGITVSESFHQAVDLILNATSAHAGGSVVVSGLGKSGLIGQKLSATLTSTGTPSHFLHPTEALHGDLGRVRHQDVVVLLSYTGSTDEIVALASILRQDQVATIAMVGRPNCELERLSTVTLHIGHVEEACPLNLAPTASATAMLALGDAIALSVMRHRHFSTEDFKKVHPGGTLGRLLAPVIEIMRFRTGENVPVIQTGSRIDQAYTATEKSAQANGLRRTGALLIVDKNETLVGIFTDADLKRSLVKNGNRVWQCPIDDYMKRHPTTLKATDLVRDAVRIVHEMRFDEIPVVDDKNRPLGLIDVQDLMSLKVVAD
ncbi:MAG: KpsF/GutQ family sugar-phosphate isomerase [Phycisphaeraceae bacterium]|nr:KpsF/GutQ family sugar-phosphate isomerase [Phycisphaeraceae bacterium]